VSSHVKIFQFDTDAFPFRRLMVELFGVEPLEDLHRAFPDESVITELPDKYTDDTTFFHRRFYDRLELGWPEFETLYESFARALGRRYFPDAAFLYQRWPTFRVQLPGSLAVGEFHRDRDYNHPHGEVNVTLPLTRAVDTSAIWIESEPGRGDYHPINLEYGEIAHFDGNNCVHGNKVNATGQTRVSFDFRLLSMDDYQTAEPKRSLGAGLPFAIGGYFKQADPVVRTNDR